MHTSKEAERLGLVGWVRNTSRGSVEGELQGSSTNVNAMKVHQHGSACMQKMLRSLLAVMTRVQA